MLGMNGPDVFPRVETCRCITPRSKGYITPVFEGTSKVPVRIETEYRIDGGDWIEEAFDNV
jgi:hypothetical protein